ncbi:MAG TPA: hypothetical protein VMY88_00155 [Acidimicrobiales bacterium]|nr:hypothetical protein [Acidimicrobiales bacterium]
MAGTNSRGRCRGSPPIGDGLGVDRLSFDNRDGSEKLTATGLGKFFPFYVTGTEVRCSVNMIHVYLLGVVPLGPHTIFCERIDSGARTIQTRESGPRVRRWDHQMRVRPSPDGRTLYSDEIIIEAGWLTGLVWV